MNTVSMHQLRLPHELYQPLQIIAGINHISVSSLVKIIISQFLSGEVVLNEPNRDNTDIKLNYRVETNSNKNT